MKSLIIFLIGITITTLFAIFLDLGFIAWLTGVIVTCLYQVMLILSEKYKLL